MNTFRAVAIFPQQLMEKIQKQESTLRYDMFFNQDKTRCTVLEEFTRPEGVFAHVQQNSELIAQLSLLGGKIEGSVFPMSQDGEAIEEIRNNWDSQYHFHFLGKTQ